MPVSYTHLDVYKRQDNNYNGLQAVTNCQNMMERDIQGLIEFNVDESVGGVIMELCDDCLLYTSTPANTGFSGW